MAKWDDAKTHNQIKAYPRGSAQGGRAIQAVKGGMSDNDGTGGHRTIIRETAEGRAIARTRNGMPMVEVESTACDIGVDHGVVDMLTIAPLNPDAYTDGNLHFTPFVAAHIASATPDDPDRPIVDEIEPPDSVKGQPPNDGDVAKCLTSGGKADKRDLVYAKKLMMALCPPSVFTGRTRLWVQALYGRHDALDLVSLASTLPSAPPALRIAGSDESQVWITTNTGVYLDPVTAEHWMISVASNVVEFFPLEAESDCIDELRLFLLDPEFPDADKERVETYILAGSKPALGKRQTASIPSATAYSMGYGWHFNWSGNCCDIVFNEVVTAPVFGHEAESIHYRLDFSRSESGVWQASRSVVEGPVRWKSFRYDFVLCEPLWEERVLFKFGAVHGPEPYGNSPVYAFYHRDTLRVVRYQCTTTNHATSRVSTPTYFAGNTYGAGGGTYAIGFDACEYEDRSDWTGRTVSFSCGGEEVVGIWGVRIANGISMQASTYNAAEPFGAWSGFYVTDVSSISAQDGYPSAIPTGAGGVYSGGGGLSGLSHGSVTISGPANVYQGSPYADAEKRQFTRYRNEYTRLLAIVPLYDAEAVYLYSMTDLELVENGYVYSTTQATPAYVHKTSPTPIDPVSSGAIVAEADQAWAGGTWSSGSAYDTYSNTRSNVVQRVVSSSGVHSFTLDSTVEFFSETESVGRTYSTWGAASGNSLYSKTASVSQGMPGAIDGDSPFSFVGWA